MNTAKVLLTTATVFALAGGLATASARDLSASVNVVRDKVAGHPYQNGGVGKDEVADMHHHRAAYNLRITFSEGARDVYAANVRLHIRDAKGKQVFALSHAGPLTDVKLPPGRYHLEAQLGHVTHKADVELKPGQPSDVQLHWAKDAR